MSDQRFMWTIFCDDVRREVGNKHSFIGVYERKLIVPTMPVMLPKLCFVMSVRTPVSQPFRQLKFSLLQDDAVVAEVDADVNGLGAGPDEEAVGNDDAAAQVMTAIAVLELSPLQVERACTFRARAITETGELKGGSLVVEKQTTAATAVA